MFNSASIDLIDWEAERIADFSTESLYQNLCAIAGITEYAPLEQRLETDGANQVDTETDAWAAGQRTPGTFKQRIEQDTESVFGDRLLELWRLGNEIDELDAGRGDYTASVNVEIPELDSHVGFYEINDSGRFSFRWEWLFKEGILTRENIESLRPILETIDPYWLEWEESEDSDNKPDLNDPYLYLDEISDGEFEQLTSAVEAIADHLRIEIANGEN